MKKKIPLLTILGCFLFLSVAVNSYGSDSLRTVHFSHPGVIRYDHHGFYINGKKVYIFSAGFHYYRTTPALWNDRLNKIKAAGFNTIETYIPWNYHEQKQGHADFSELDKFLDACEAHHLWVIIRPGPYICAEWNAGGFPNWLAYKAIGYRTDTPADIKWSKYYYNEVLPIIRKHLITNGGNIILMQLENEYDFSGIPDTLRTNYLRSLYHDALDNHIDVPLITCWTSVSRNNTDPELSQIMDADNFYPGYKLNGVGKSIRIMLRTEPYSPGMITELQGGWFSDVGGKAIRYPQKYGAAQVNDLTKFVIAHGVDGFNYYMGYGGTNFGYWGAATITNSYDYTAPISEAGGLWSKYRAVKLIGDFLHTTGAQYTDMSKVWNEASTSTPGIKLLMRGKGNQRILFVRNETDTAKVAQVELHEGSSEHPITIAMPKHGAKFLFIDKDLDGVHVKNANIQFNEADMIGKTPFLLGYGTNGEKASFSINGKSVSGKITDNDQWMNENGAVVGLTSMNRAAKTRVFSSGDNTIALISDSYLINKKRIDKNRFDLAVQTRPGEDHFTIVSSRKARAVRVNRHRVHIASRKEGNIYLNTFTVATGDSPFKSIPVTKAHAEIDPGENGSQGQSIKTMSDGTYASLGMNGLFDNGYYVYTGKVSLPSKGYLKLSFYNDDWHGVYLDGKYVPSLSRNSYASTANLADILQNGQQEHSIRIVYENGSRLNFPDVVRRQLKGLVSMSVLQKPDELELSTWKLSPHPAEALVGRPPQSQTWFDDRQWPNFKVDDWRTLLRAGLADHTASWYRNYFTLTPKEVSDSRLALDFQAVYGDATVFINGKKVTEKNGRYTSFNVPLSGLVHAGQNVVAVYIKNTQGLGGLYRPAVLKYGQDKVSGQLTVNKGLEGLHEGWNNPGRVHSFNGKTADINSMLSNGGDIVWYRTTFDLHSNRDWVTPLAAKIKATGEVQIWINGHLQGNYSPKGPQKMFYLPKNWLKKGENSLVLILRPTPKSGTDPKIDSVSITPYSQYVVKKNDVQIDF